MAPRGRPKKTTSEEERRVREKWEQRMQEEEEKMREEQEQKQSVYGFNLTKEQRRIRRAVYHRTRHQAKMKRVGKKGVARRQSDEETRKLNVESRLPIKALPPGRSKKTMSEEERRVREKCEQRIQEEEERIREERKQHVHGFNLTKEQRRIRRVISQRAGQLRARTQREAEDDMNRQETVKRVLSEEEQRLRAEREQAEEKLMRE